MFLSSGFKASASFSYNYYNYRDNHYYHYHHYNLLHNCISDYSRAVIDKFFLIFLFKCSFLRVLKHLPVSPTIITIIVIIIIIIIIIIIFFMIASQIIRVPLLINFSARNHQHYPLRPLLKSGKNSLFKLRLLLIVVKWRINQCSLLCYVSIWGYLFVRAFVPQCSFTVLV